MKNIRTRGVLLMVNIDQITAKRKRLAFNKSLKILFLLKRGQQSGEYNRWL